MQPLSIYTLSKLTREWLSYDATGEMRFVKTEPGVYEIHQRKDYQGWKMVSRCVEDSAKDAAKTFHAWAREWKYEWKYLI